MFILKLINVVLTLLIGTIAHGGTVDEAQRLLNKLGYDAGVVDGLYGSKTRSALVEFYSDKPEKFDGRLSTNEILDLA
jgi:peptidoglycan hydrolase-like protein with peptidoglycan-binding domain